MTLRQFIRENRREIDAVIKQECPNAERFDDVEREMWMLNNYGLYQWAQESGVDI